MGKKQKKANFWVRRLSHLPILVIGSVVVLVLYFNEETSWVQNIEYDKRITKLKKQIKEERDSAMFYHERRKAVESGKADLEYLAREQFHMQRPTEDVFRIIE